MKPGESEVRHIPLKPVTLDGRKALQVGDKEEFLIELQEPAGEWKLVEEITGNIPFETLKTRYAIWKDKEIIRGDIFWGDIIRQKDGVIQNDELTEFRHSHPSEIKQFDHVVDAGKGVYDGNNFDIIKPEARITVRQTENGPECILEETWTCTSEFNR